MRALLGAQGLGYHTRGHFLAHLKTSLFLREVFCFVHGCYHTQHCLLYKPEDRFSKMITPPPLQLAFTLARPCHSCPP